MPPRDPLQRARDILDAARAIRSYVEGMDESAFRTDRRTLDAVLRNVVVHEYFGVDVGILWQTATKDVPELEAALSAVVSDLGRETETRDDSDRGGD